MESTLTGKSFQERSKYIAKIDGNITGSILVPRIVVGNPMTLRTVSMAN